MTLNLEERSSGELRAVDCDTLHGCPEQVTDVGAVAGDEGMAAEGDCSGQYRLVLVVDRQDSRTLIVTTEREDPDRRGQCIESGKR